MQTQRPILPRTASNMDFVREQLAIKNKKALKQHTGTIILVAKRGKTLTLPTFEDISPNPTPNLPLALLNPLNPTPMPLIQDRAETQRLMLESEWNTFNSELNIILNTH